MCFASGDALRGILLRPALCDRGRTLIECCHLLLLRAKGCPVNSELDCGVDRFVSEQLGHYVHTLRRMHRTLC